MTPTIVTLWPVVLRTTFLAAFAAAVPATAAPVNGAQTGAMTQPHVPVPRPTI
jgi:hypothetical protein